MDVDGRGECGCGTTKQDRLERELDPTGLAILSVDLNLIALESVLGDRIFELGSESWMKQSRKTTVEELAGRVAGQLPASGVDIEDSIGVEYENRR